MGGMGYITRAIVGVNNAARRGSKSEVALKMAGSSYINLVVEGDPQHFRVWDKLTRGP